MTDTIDQSIDQQAGTEEEPQVFDVQKDLSGDWRFNRRDFLTAATAATLAGTLAGCGSESETKVQEASVGTPELEPTLELSTLGPAATPGPADLSTTCQDLKAHDQAITALAISPDGSLLISSSEDQTLKLWSLPEGYLLKTLEDSTQVVLTMAITSDGSLLASGGEDGLVKFWSLPDGELLNTLTDQSMVGPISALAFARDGLLLVAANKAGGIMLYTLSDTQPLDSLGIGTVADVMALTPDGMLLASVMFDGDTTLWSLADSQDPQEVARFTDHGSLVQAVALTPDGSLLVSGDAHGVIEIRTVPDGEVVHTLKHSSGAICYLAVSPDGTKLFSGSQDGTVKVWLLSNGEPLIAAESNTMTTKLVVAPEEPLFVVGTREGHIRLWSLVDGEIISCLVDSSVNVDVELVDIELNSGQTVSIPVGVTIPLGAVCTCNTVTVCSCVGHTCSCVGHTSGGSGGHYWFPN
ncbi:MAG: WD40 repeat domain-containing protein [Anaerolineae bacterium]|nr:WD40 repeat domain-containing protein [Anaerolineae bacterium]